jgi:halogenation protein CepH
MKDHAETYDLVVIGGGPAGSALATLVAMQGHKVLLLEKEQFPRHQIGESLLPATIHGICPLLGVSEEIKNAGFMRKLGGTFRWGTNTKPWTFYFSLSSKMAGPTSYAYQVERSKFDAILLNNARRKGVEVRERTSVTNLLEESGRIVGVRAADDSGKAFEARGRYVADTSGNQSRTGERIGERIYSNFFQNVALYGYYEGGKRLPAPNNGNILCASFDRGWFWYIPLSETLTSVGAVVGREHVNWQEQTQQQAMDEYIAACPTISEYLKGANRVTEGQYGKLRVRKDYSYCCTRFWAPGVVLAGDAACFIDPVFSSGVHLATYSAMLAARSINSCLRGTVDEDKAFKEFEMRYRREYANFYQFLVAFYNLEQDENSYFWSARKVLGSEEAANEAFVRLVGGIGTSGEPLFGDSNQLFGTLNAVCDSFQRASPAPGEFDQSKLDRRFMTNLMHEGMQLQLQNAAPDMLSKTPFWSSGLVPSLDGSQWEAPQ